MFPEARSVTQWLRHGWAIPIAYVVGFFVMLSVWTWHPDPPKKMREGENGVRIESTVTEH